MLDELDAALIHRWQQVPRLAVEQALTLLPLVTKLASLELPPEAFVIHHPGSGENRTILTEDDLPSDADHWILIKTAEGEWAPLSKARELFTAAQKPLGGPGPLQTALVGGLLGGGLGYAGGALAENLAPGTFRKGKLRRLAGMLGAGLGAAPGAYLSTMQFRQNPNGGSNADAGWSWTQYPQDVPTAPMSVDSVLNPEFRKLAMDYPDTFGSGGSLGSSTVPVDAFNNAIWSDVNPNRFGTKSRWGNNEQSLGTPLPVAAAASGLVSGAAALTGNSEAVSPLAIGLAAAKGGAAGLVTGLMAGKALGALAGLTPQRQEQLQQAGLWGGILSAVMGKVFGG